MSEKNEMTTEKTDKQQRYEQEFADTFVALMKEGKMPFQRQLEAGEVYGQQPHNAITGRDYQGDNALRLVVEREAEGHKNSGWVALNQLNDMRTSVFKGSQGAPVLASSMKEGKPTQHYYHVFNVDDVKNANVQPLDQKPKLSKKEAQRIDQILADSLNPESKNKERDYLVHEIASMMIAQKYGKAHTPLEPPQDLDKYLNNIQGKPQALMYAANAAQEIIAEVEKIPTIHTKAAQTEVLTKEQIDQNRQAYKDMKELEQQDRHYLKVPYDKKDDVKAMGAQWDSFNKQWYVSKDQDLTQFREFEPVNTKLLLAVSNLSQDMAVEDRAHHIAGIAKMYVHDESRAEHLSNLMNSVGIPLDKDKVMEISFAQSIDNAEKIALEVTPSNQEIQKNLEKIIGKER